MKRLFISLFIAFTVITANAQSRNYYHHTYHWGDGTCTSVSTYGNHTYVSTYRNVRDYAFYYAYDSLGNKFEFGLHPDSEFEMDKLTVPAPGVGFTIYAKDMENPRDIKWYNCGRITVEKKPNLSGHETRGLMKYEPCGEMTLDEVKNTNYSTFIVYDDHLEHFIDSYIKPISARKLHKKYGYGLVIDSDILVILKVK